MTEEKKGAPQWALLIPVILVMPFSLWLLLVGMGFVFEGAESLPPLESFMKFYARKPILWFISFFSSVVTWGLLYILVVKVLRPKAVAAGRRTEPLGGDDDDDDDDDDEAVWGTNPRDAVEEAEWCDHDEAVASLRSARENLADAKIDIAHWERVVKLTR